EGPAFLLPSRLLFGSRSRRTRPAPGFLVSLVPFRDESLMRSRMALISDAPASRVIGLRGVAQLMAQMNLVGGIAAPPKGGPALPQLSHLFSATVIAGNLADF